MTDTPSDEAFEKACGYLSYRQRTEQEMVRYLAKRGYSDVSETVINRLKRSGLVDDRVFAETWVSERAGGRGYGARRLRSELFRLGVNAILIEETLTAAYPEDKEDERAAAIAARQWPKISGKTPYDRGRKLYSFLIRLGFDTPAAKAAVEALLDEAKDAD
jgi:regulatory protein